MKTFVKSILFVVVISSTIACSKGGGGNGSPGGIVINPNGVTGPYFASALGNDTGGAQNPTIQMELSFFSYQGFNSINNPISAQGFLLLPNDPYGCPYLQNLYYTGVREIQVTTLQQGTMSASTFSGISLQSVSGYPLQININGHFVTGGSIPGYKANAGGNNFYSYGLEAQLYIQQCPSIVNPIYINYIY